MNARFIFGTFVACLLFLRAWGDVAQAQPALGAFADVSAHWAEPPVGGTVTNSANGALVAQPPVAIVVADTYHALDPEGASARAIAMVSPAPGEKFLRSASSVGGDSPELPNSSMDATATARVVTQWLVMSDGSVVQPGSPVLLDAILSFDGTLSAFNFGHPFSEVTATMNVYQGGVMTTVFQGGGRLEYDIEFQDYDFVDSGDFLGRFIVPGAAYLSFDESYDDFFSVNVGELFEVELILTTHAGSPVVYGESEADADFYNSGGFSLSTGEVGGLTLSQIIPVPEPEFYSMLAAGLGLMSFVARRREFVSMFEYPWSMQTSSRDTILPHARSLFPK